ncbi:hypothetical protein KLAF111653_00665 [Klebsiella africana]|uniref:Uncharacterized protein n=1 Tax=Klebsiella africana TaxID=2489010 RepID=A0A8B6ILG1_9ENTR|nr:hypothetical protein SB5857_00766 [Klebsiella africana]
MLPVVTRGFHRFVVGLQILALICHKGMLKTGNRATVSLD